MFESSSSDTRFQSANVAAPDSLASVAPRLITLCEQIASGTSHIESSFGISRPESGESGRSDNQPILLEQLRRCECLLMGSVARLENINRHVNG
jgi:hypothetical protein